VAKGRKANDLFNLLTTTFSRFNLLQKLVGQTYDGASVASVMAREQSKIRSIAAQANKVHTLLCPQTKFNITGRFR
jgi:hypothetical protein